MTQIIELTITATGETKLETKGFAGQSCREASRFLEEALGRHKSEHVTKEFHEQARAESIPTGTIQTRPT